LLSDLSAVATERRGAHYVCHMTLADPQGVVHADCEARCLGRIRESEVGDGGFGYDPLFEVVEYHRTFGQMDGALKSILSHRARATRLLVPQLVAILKAGDWK
jgi:XTP/dITP diphosphohydrolase